MLRCIHALLPSLVWKDMPLGLASHPGDSFVVAVGAVYKFLGSRIFFPQ